MTKRTFDSGQYVGVDGEGRYHRLGHHRDITPPQPPSKTICRRVLDYPHGRPPAIAALTHCVECGDAIAFNPAGPHQDVPKICMQCAGIDPLPITEAS